MMIPLVAASEFAAKLCPGKKGNSGWQPPPAPPVPAALEKLETAEDLLRALGLPQPPPKEEGGGECGEAGGGGAGGGGGDGGGGGGGGGLEELSRVLLDRKVNGTRLWTAIFAAVPPDLELSPETVAALHANKPMLIRCFERVGRAKLYAGFNTWRTDWAMAKLIAAMDEDDDDDDDDRPGTGI